MKNRAKRFALFFIREICGIRWPKRSLRVSVVKFLAVVALLSLSCYRTETIIVFHDQSLAPLIESLAERFQRNHPRLIIQTQSRAGLEAVRKIAAGVESCDLLAVADARLMQRFLAPVQASLAYEFLGNELVLAATHRELTAGSGAGAGQTWYDQLFSLHYSYGIADPDRDPAGYHAQLSWKLAEIHYRRPGLYRRFLEGLRRDWVRPDAAELVVLLKAQRLDAAFLYKSTALQNNLQFTELPAQVSLGESSYADLYSRVYFEVAAEGQGSRLEMTAAPIRYGICLLNDAHPSAERFLQFLLSPEAQQLYRELGYMSVPIRRLTW